jgi:hypothetical protein
MMNPRGFFFFLLSSLFIPFIPSREHQMFFIYVFCSEEGMACRLTVPYSNDKGLKSPSHVCGNGSLGPGSICGYPLLWILGAQSLWILGSQSR